MPHSPDAVHKPCAREGGGRSGGGPAWSGWPATGGAAWRLRACCMAQSNGMCIRSPRYSPCQQPTNRLPAHRGSGAEGHAAVKAATQPGGAALLLGCTLRASLQPASSPSEVAGAVGGDHRVHCGLCSASTCVCRPPHMVPRATPAAVDRLLMNAGGRIDRCRPAMPSGLAEQEGDQEGGREAGHRPGARSWAGDSTSVVMHCLGDCRFDRKRHFVRVPTPGGRRRQRGGMPGRGLAREMCLPNCSPFGRISCQVPHVWLRCGTSQEQAASRSGGAAAALGRAPAGKQVGMNRPACPPSITDQLTAP